LKKKKKTKRLASKEPTLLCFFVPPAFLTYWSWKTGIEQGKHNKKKVGVKKNSYRRRQLLYEIKSWGEIKKKNNKWWFVSECVKQSKIVFWRQNSLKNKIRQTAPLAMVARKNVPGNFSNVFLWKKRVEEFLGPFFPVLGRIGLGNHCQWSCLRRWLFFTDCLVFENLHTRLGNYKEFLGSYCFILCLLLSES